MIVYKVVNKVTGHFYIGRTKQRLSSRKSRHLNNCSCPLLKRAIELYGRDNFEFEIMARCFNERTLDITEKRYITMFKPQYNTTKGGIGGDTRSGVKLSQETKDRMSESAKRVAHRKGIKWSEVHKKNLSRKLKGNKNQSAKRT